MDDHEILEQNSLARAKESKTMMRGDSSITTKKPWPFRQAPEMGKK